jgi:hypothetical protein
MTVLGAEGGFGEFLWVMIVFFIWFMIVWMFIRIFIDNFRRRDRSGWAKAGCWTSSHFLLLGAHSRFLSLRTHQGRT